MDLLTVIQSTLGTRRDDDLTDRLNHIYTTMLLVLFTVVVTAKQYVGEPIDCWCPAQFTRNYILYTNNICWVTNTYYIPMNETVPETDARNQPQLKYYQWVPFILLSMGLLYQIPCRIWRTNNERSGVNVNNLINLSNFYMECETKKQRDKYVKMLTSHLERYLVIKKTFRWSMRTGVVGEILKIFCFWTGAEYGNFLPQLYLFTKLLYLLNSVGQFILVDVLLTGGINFYGAQLFRNFVEGKVYKNSVYFPRVTLCSFYVREMGLEAVGHRYTVQCVLSINLFSEAIFAFYWFLLVILTIANAFSFLKWTYYSFFSISSISYVKKHIRRELLEQNYNSSIDDFTNNFLRSEGLFALRLISHNSNDLVVTDIVSSMFENYKILNTNLIDS